MSEFESHEGLPREAEVLRARRESLERLREAGIEPFALRYDVDTLASDLDPPSSRGSSRTRRSPTDVRPSPVASCWLVGTAS